VDAPTCKNVVLARVVGSMTEFKQIIGRGTRVRDDYGKLFFSILDYTGSATRLFADREFDGDPEFVTQVEIDAAGQVVSTTEPGKDGGDDLPQPNGEDGVGPVQDGPKRERRKYYVDGGLVEIAAHLVHEFDSDGRQLRVVKFTDYAAEKVRTLYPSAAEMRTRWADPEGRSKIIALLEERGVDFDELAAASNHAEADPFDLLCHLAFNAPLRGRPPRDSRGRVRGGRVRGRLRGRGGRDRVRDRGGARAAVDLLPLDQDQLDVPPGGVVSAGRRSWWRRVFGG
jgi:type I restriction enzyme R subunit